MGVKHLLALRELEAGTISHLLDDAQAWAAGQGGEPEVLRDCSVATLFYEPSTRTEIAFGLAARRLGAEIVRCDVGRSSVQKGESLIDTAHTLEALGLDAIILRHPSGGAAHLLARSVACAIINAGDGMHEHPTQGLVDLLTVRQVKGRIAGLQVVIVGDVLHSRVARSALWGFTKLGAHVRLVGPSTLLPVGVEALGVQTTASLEEGMDGAEVVMALRMQLERQSGGFVPSLGEYARCYQITPRVLARAHPDAILMHPGPMNPGVEIDVAAAYGPRSVIATQVANGVPVRMAVLTWALGRARAQSRDARRAAELVMATADAST